MEVTDTTFKTASSTYGGINNNGELLVDGCKFLDNDRSSDSGVYSTAITSYNKATILNSEFKNNNKISLISFNSPYDTQLNSWNTFKGYYQSYFNSIISNCFNWVRKENNDTLQGECERYEEN